MPNFTISFTNANIDHSLPTIPQAGEVFKYGGRQYLALSVIEVAGREPLVLVESKYDPAHAAYASQAAAQNLPQIPVGRQRQSTVGAVSAR
ncbi:hypothetical protein IGB42_03862 [Andreprevotia sp. IGB-42]|uniref:hypothetical protein n=1 Tax=Andreprevotia sp. IGB-42 TaxID=2497473 RepID=UPI001357D00F|nr:hypothetical protein [Andreprevotia sp. IGB-42]KAF0811703.1 hypothetical protein IGB42_03862 [Andreprevotia sp. IGB-42]